MKRSSLLPLLCVSLISSAFISTSAYANTWLNLNKGGQLKAFSSEEELNIWLSSKKQELEKFQKEEAKRRQAERSKQSEMVMMAPAPTAAKMDAAPAQGVTSESITNTQTAGVDEGGIVKVHGDHLVILRRGRLFTVDIAGNNLKAVSVVDAFAPGSSGSAWYDEMLVSGNTVVVIGYSYQKQGTEVVLFNINDQGDLSYKSTYVLKSNDYYSSRNYASRLVGNKLVFYTPLFLNFNQNPLNSFPTIREWKGNKGSDFKPLAPATKIYRVDDNLDPRNGIALHTVQTCDLSVEPMNCTASGVLGSAGREFYVSQDAVFVWTTPCRYRGQSASSEPISSAVFRLPLDHAEPPSALKTMGSPIDQFSFLEKDGYLNVLLRSEGPSASMWASEIGSQNLALLRVPVNEFGDGKEAAANNHYYPLSAPSGGHAIQNRYVDNYLVYGAGASWGRAGQNLDQSAYLLNWQIPQLAPVKIPVSHSVDRIEALGKYPLLVGGKEGNLLFSTISPSLASPAMQNKAEVISSFKLSGAAQGETRSHGFFYKPDSENSGLLGLPFRAGNASGWQQLKKVSTGIIYLENNELNLQELGTLGASPNPVTQDNCRASCVDWYGNSRPIFLRGRVFALMGYELVEGKIKDKRLVEVQRIDFTPSQKVAR